MVIVALGAAFVHERSRADRIQRTASVATLADRALREPGSRTGDLRNGRLHLSAVIDRTGSGYVFASDLPKLAANRSYQLWGVKGDTVVSLGVFGPDPGVVAFTAPPDLEALAITNEVRGGVVTSTSEPVASGPLR